MNILLYAINVICSSSQSTISKKYSSAGGDTASFNISKAISGIAFFTIFGLLFGFEFHLPTLIFAIFYGVFLCAAMHCGLKALSMGPMAITSILASFSLIIPYFYGIIVWRETPSPFGIFGIIFLIVSVLMLNLRKESGISVKWSFYIFSTMLANGICSIIQKYHQTYFPSQYQSEFTVFSLITVLLILMTVQIATRHVKEIRLCGSGFLAGILDNTAAYIVLYLAATEKAAVLFPVTSVLKIIAVWILGKIVFGEKLKGIQIFGLILGVLSVVLLKI